MLVYFFVNIIIILIGICSWRGKKLKSLFWPCAVLVFISSFRGAFTTDYIAYESYFRIIDEKVEMSRILSISSNFPMEKGYVLINKVIGMFTDSTIVYFTIISTLTIFIIAKVVKNNSLLPWLSVFLFVTIGDYYASFNLMRQVLAASICFMAFEQLKSKNFKKYMCIVVIAATIHISSLIMIPMYFLLQIKLNKKTIIMYITISCALFAFLNEIMLLGQQIFVKYDGYIYGLDEGTVNAIIPIIGIVLFVLFSWKFKKTTFDFNDNGNNIMLNAIIWALIFGILAIKIYIFNRFMYFFKPYIILLVPNILNGYKDYRDKNIVIVAILIIGCLFTQITLSGTGYDPYYFIFK